MRVKRSSRVEKEPDSVSTRTQAFRTTGFFRKRTAKHPLRSPFLSSTLRLVFVKAGLELRANIGSRAKRNVCASPLTPDFRNARRCTRWCRDLSSVSRRVLFIGSWRISHFLGPKISAPIVPTSHHDWFWLYPAQICWFLL